MLRNTNPVEGATVTELASETGVSLDRMVALKFKEAAQLLSVSEASINRAVNEGKLPAVSIIGGRRIRRTDLDFYLESHPYEPAA